MEKKIITVRGMQIGAGVPKICIPLVARDVEQLEDALELAKTSPFDLVEWRADFYEQVQDAQVQRDALERIRYQIGDRPLLFTFRSKKEGGNREIDDAGYYALNEFVAKSGLADLIDIEVFRNTEETREQIRRIHSHGALVLGSNHDFAHTPPAEEMVKRLVQMQQMGVDITKIAVMPESKEDVLELLLASIQMEEVYGDRPCVTMSMGSLGLISRICGSFSGSAITFGTAGSASAPGQIPASDMRSVLQILSESVG